MAPKTKSFPMTEWTNKPFDPDTSEPVPDNPDWEMGQPVEGMRTKQERYQKNQRYKAPSKRDNPVMDYCKGGKVIKSHGR